jgi:hypothetical protein
MGSSGHRKLLQKALVSKAVDLRSPLQDCCSINIGAVGGAQPDSYLQAHVPKSAEKRSPAARRPVWSEEDSVTWHRRRRCKANGHRRSERRKAGSTRICDCHIGKANGCDHRILGSSLINFHPTSH